MNDINEEKETSMQQQEGGRRNKYANLETFCKSYFYRLEDVVSDSLRINLPNQKSSNISLPKSQYRDVPHSNQYAGSFMSSKEFDGKIIVLEDRNILPNGVVIHHSGKVEYSEDYYK